MPLFLQLSHLVMSDSLQPHGLQHPRLPCPSPTPGAHCPQTIDIPGEMRRIDELVESLKMKERAQ